MPHLPMPPADAPAFRSVHKTGLPGDGPVTGHAINLVVKKRVAVAGLDPADFGGHSLRAGFVTQAVRAGADVGSIMRQTGHRSPSMVEVYRRENAPLVGNAVTRIDLGTPARRRPVRNAGVRTTTVAQQLGQLPGADHPDPGGVPFGPSWCLAGMPPTGWCGWTPPGRADPRVERPAT